MMKCILSACASLIIIGAPTGPPITQHAAGLAPLGPMPNRCAGSTRPRRLIPAFGPVIGTSPLWGALFGAPGHLAHLAVLIDTAAPTTPYGWGYKVTWIVRRAFSGRVTLRGTALGSGRPLWFGVAIRRAVRTLTITARYPSRVGTGSIAWAGIPDEVYVPAAGCYALHASWHGGSWTRIVAAGRAS